MQTTTVDTDTMNRAMALFMGMTLCKDGYLRHGKEWHDTIHESLLKYHSSWDWLMPAWFKCQQIGADLGTVFSKFYQAFHAGIDQQDITICHRAVYDFIVWYNNQKQ